MRNVQLGFSFGVAAFLIGIPFTSRIAMFLAERLDAMGGGLVPFLIGGLISQLPTLLVAPAVAWAAGLYFDGPRWAMAISMMFGVQVFPLAITAITAGPGQLAHPVRLALLLVCSAAGTVFSAATYRRAQRRMTARAEARQREVDAAGRLARLDFEKLPAQTSPEAGEATGGEVIPAMAAADGVVPVDPASVEGSTDSAPGKPPSA